MTQPKTPAVFGGDGNVRVDLSEGADLNRRAQIEQVMFDAAGQVRPMPTPDQLRLWALALGTPKEIWSDEIKEAVKRP